MTDSNTVTIKKWHDENDGKSPERLKEETRALLIENLGTPKTEKAKENMERILNENWG